MKRKSKNKSEIDNIFSNIINNDIITNTTTTNNNNTTTNNNNNNTDNNKDNINKDPVLEKQSINQLYKKMDIKDKDLIDGLKIYSINELNIGKGGGTEDCPFDCKCCY